MSRLYCIRIPALWAMGIKGLRLRETGAPAHHIYFPFCDSELMCQNECLPVCAVCESSFRLIPLSLNQGDAIAFDILDCFKLNHSTVKYKNKNILL